MTGRRDLLLLGVIIAACVLPIAGSRQRAHTAAQRLDAATTSLDGTRRLAADIVRLRGQEAQVAEQKRPEQDLVARIISAMAEAGVPSNRHLGQVQPMADRAPPGSSGGARAYMEQSVQVTLDELAPAQVGAFLSRWSASEPLWTPTRIELSHHRGADRRGRGAGGDLDRYDMTVLMTATYVAPKGPSP